MRINHLLVTFLSCSCLLLSAKEAKLIFIENKSQVVDQNGIEQKDVLFSGETEGMVFHIKSRGISYQLNKRNGEDRIGIYRIDLNWRNANSTYKVKTGNTVNGVFHYYNDNGNILNIKSYSDILIENIYSNINLHYYSKEGALKYDYIVKPFTDYRKIKFSISGSTKVGVDSKGQLNIQTPYGTITEAKPYVYQGNKALKASWVVDGNTISFAIENTDPSKELVIDPVVRLWGTYYGASNDDTGTSVTTDASGNVYMAGYTYSVSTNLATSGAHQTTYGGGSLDGFIAKFDANGNRLWATYYGGAGADDFSDICVDATGNVFVAGSATSNSLAITTVGSHQQIRGGLSDAFLVKFNSSGIRQWATFYGDVGNDYGMSCAVNLSGEVYLTGTTYSVTTASVIATSGSHQGTFGGNSDGFLVKFNASGVRQWATFYGDVGAEEIYSCFANGSGDVLIAGKTKGVITNSVIATPGSHDDTFSVLEDAFVAKFNSAGVRQWATFYGGSGDEAFNDVCEDAIGNIYLCGQSNTSTSNIIASAGGHQTAFGGGVNPDAFLVKFNSLGVRQWGTYYGGNTISDMGRSCKVDNAGNIILAGGTGTSASGIISTAGSYQPGYGGTFDGYIAKFNSAGVRQWGTYYGGTNADDVFNIAIDTQDNIFLVGHSYSSAPSNVIASAGSFQTSLSGIRDAFLAKIYDCPNVSISLNSLNNVSCFGGNDGSAIITATNGTSFTYTWTPLGGNSSSVSALTAGTYTCNSTNQCGGTGSIVLTVTQPSAALTSTTNASSVSVCPNASVALSSTISGGTAPYTYTWSFGANTASAVTSIISNTILTLSTSDSKGCTNSSTLAVGTLSVPLITISGQSLTCSNKSIVLTGSGALSYTWFPATSIGSSLAITPTINATYNVIGTAANSCTNTSTFNISVVLPQTPSICMVTVDSLGINNEIYWDKGSYTNVDSFIVYREVSTNIYRRIGALHKSAFSMLTDTSRSIGPANGDPKLTAYKYKLQLRDTCGNYSALSLWHQTIFIQDQMNGNFNWNSYAIESSTSPVANYNLKRRDLLTGTETLVGSTTSNVFTDPQYALFWPTNVKWLVDAVGFSCNASLAQTVKGGNSIQVLKTKTKSNQSNDRTFPTGTIEIGTGSLGILTYPNPAHGMLYITLNNISTRKINIELVNALGQVLLSKNEVNTTEILNIQNIDSGVYILRIIENTKIIGNRKVIIE